MTSPTTDPADPLERPTGDPAEPVGPETTTGPGGDDPDPQPQASVQADDALPPYDAVVLLSFGGPEAPEEVMPFLRRVTAGRGVPDERLAEVAEHYLERGGRSPINDQNRALREALRAELRRRGLATPVLWGNRNSEPFLADTLREAHQAGHRRVLVVTTSAYSSYSSCRQYREDIAGALAELAEEGRTLQVDKVRQYATHPAFGRVNARLVTDALRELDGPEGPATQVVFVTHSIPTAMDETSGPGDGEGSLYSTQHRQLAGAILDEAAATLGRQVEGELVYCSRSGSPRQPWLEPDVNDHLRDLAARGVTHVALAPIGFVSDHMEVVHDLDTEAGETARELGLALVRVPTVGVDPEFVSGLVDLLEERAAQARGEQVEMPAWPGEARPPVCEPGCCPNLRQSLPAACGRD